jgi:hypothetical protein
MSIILTGDIGEVTRGTNMMRIVRPKDGFMKEITGGISFTILEKAMVTNACS